MEGGTREPMKEFLLVYCDPLESTFWAQLMQFWLFGLWALDVSVYGFRGLPLLLLIVCSGVVLCLLRCSIRRFGFYSRLCSLNP